MAARTFPRCLHPGHYLNNNNNNNNNNLFPYQTKYKIYNNKKTYTVDNTWTNSGNYTGPEAIKDKVPCSCVYE